jgi:hypothetical protein
MRPPAHSTSRLSSLAFSQRTRPPEKPSADAARGTHFTCFTSTITGFTTLLELQQAVRRARPPLTHITARVSQRARPPPAPHHSHLQPCHSVLRPEAAGPGARHQTAYDSGASVARPRLPLLYIYIYIYRERERAYVSIRQHTTASHQTAYGSGESVARPRLPPLHTHTHTHTHSHSHTCIFMYVFIYIYAYIHTYIYSIRQHTSAYASASSDSRWHTSAYVSIHQHKSAYVSTSCDSRRLQRICSLSPPSPPAYVSIRQHTSAYVSIRGHLTAHGSGHRPLALASLSYFGSPYMCIFLIVYILF